MSEIVCLLPMSATAVECICFDQKVCDIHIDDGGNLVCRYGSNEGIIDGIASVICPLEIDTERKKWESFLNKEIR
ncbi:MAG: M20 family metallo-hydrolase [Crenarchaeota archaeon]|nr:M20 family metallo-hydrolase [Thermoproteota archaeon]